MSLATTDSHAQLNYLINKEPSLNVLGGLVRYRGDSTNHNNAPSAITQIRLEAVEDIPHLAILVFSHSPSIR